MKEKNQIIIGVENNKCYLLDTDLLPKPQLTFLIDHLAKNDFNINSFITLDEDLNNIDYDWSISFKYKIRIIINSIPIQTFEPTGEIDEILVEDYIYAFDIRPIFKGEIHEC